MSALKNETEETNDGFWACNIDRRGRLIRFVAGLLCLGAAAWLWWGLSDRFWSVGLLALGAVAIFEAARGWCVMRAFGARTPF